METPILGTGTGRRHSLNKPALALLDPTAAAWAGSAPAPDRGEPGSRQKHAPEMLVRTVMDRRIARADGERVSCRAQVPDPLPPALPDEWDRAQLGPPPTPGCYKGQVTSCPSLCKAVLGLIWPQKGEKGDMRLLATAQKTPGEHKVFFFLCLPLLSAIIIS